MRSSLRAIIPVLAVGVAMGVATIAATGAAAAAAGAATTSAGAAAAAATTTGAAADTQATPPAAARTSGPSRAAAAKTITWLDYDAGLAKAKEAGKPVLVSFWADWCGYCRKMRSETYTDPKVIAEVTAKFVAVSVNTTTQQKLAADYYVRGLPTIWFLTSDGGKITALPGYVDAPMFLKVLRFIDTRSYEKMDFQAFLNGES